MTNHNIPQLDRLIRGIEIIRKYETDPFPCAAEHDVFFCGGYETRAQMTEEERKLMEEYGWHNEYDSWAFYT